ncbi:uncharacterized protein gprin1 [Gadus morhua]|uniref:Uncharacterized LOC115551850 n=1 Tax=Gadus morhua TaxID=8049 RepID=A0A8C5FI54_GADMO|nr:uncharacterized protein LOC115551850 [Gadus morhua]
MGSLEDESGRPVKDCQHRAGDTDDGEHLGGADALRAGPQPSPTNTGQRSASQEDRRPQVQKVNIHEEEPETSEAAVDPAVAVDGATVVVPAEPPAAMTRVATDSCPHVESVPLEVDPPGPDDPATEDKVVAASTRSATLPSCGPTDSETRNRKPNTQEGRAVAESLSVDKTTGKEKPEQGGGEEAGGGGAGGGGAGGGGAGGGVEAPPVPPSPAPPGQQHMRTQVSLEVVQCHSVACSPMTPPGGGHTFVFPEGAQSNDGKVQVEYRSIATAPMTPRTPTASTYPDVVKGESGRGEGEVRMGNRSPEKGPAQLASSQVTAQPPGRPQTHRIPSMDQDITILVTQHDSTTDSQDEEDEEEAKVSGSAVAGPIGKIEENEDHKADGEAMETGDRVGKERVDSQVSTANSHTEKKSLNEHVPNKPISNLQQSKMQIEGPSIIFRDKGHPVEKRTSESTMGATKEEASLGANLPEGVTKEAGSLNMPAVPNSPAPSGCSNMYTQVSLEVVQCQSAATSPMTPPEGGNAFIFPPSTATKPQVEYRSIATAPMTPRTPLAPVGFPTRATAEPEVQRMPEMGTDKGKGNAGETVADVHEEGGSSVGNGEVEIGEVEGTTGDEGKDEGTSGEAEADGSAGREGKVEDKSGEEGKMEDMTGKEGKMDGMTVREGKVEDKSGEEGKVEGTTGEAEADGSTGREGKMDGRSGKEGKVEVKSGDKGKMEDTLGEKGKGEDTSGKKGKVEGTSGKKGKVEGTLGEEGKVEGTTVRKSKLDCSTGREGKVDGTTSGEESAENNCKEGVEEEESEEPVQEVSWDDKGMTWEVYGAVVEVAVLGSAIQKHLEKQVKKQKQPSLPPPPPLDPSAVPLPCPSPGTTTTSTTATSTTAASVNATTDPTQASSGKGRAGMRGERGVKEGRRRRNPFRLLLRNMQQPRCCSRAHSAE